MTPAADIISRGARRIADRSARTLDSGRALRVVYLFLIVWAVAYNAVFAAINAHGLSISYAVVTANELLILVGGLGASLAAGFERRDTGPVVLLYLGAATALLVSMTHDTVFVTGIRNFALIAVFSMIGLRAGETVVRDAFRIVAVLVLLVLVWEIISVNSYAAFFQPASYLANSRGYSVSEFDSTGLSAGTYNFSGRFSFGIFSGRRTSSIFLEQVSLNCFAIILLIYTVFQWRRLHRLWRAVFLGCIALAIVSNNARMATIMVVALPVAGLMFPFLHRGLIALVPLGVATAIGMLFQFVRSVRGDDLVGRLAVTYDLFAQIDAGSYLFGNPALSLKAFDSGYAFLLASSTLFGVAAFIAYLILFQDFSQPRTARASWSVSAYVLVWLTVGGTGAFSIKTASLLWAFVGSLRADAAHDTPAPRARPVAVSVRFRPAT